VDFFETNNAALSTANTTKAGICTDRVFFV